MRSADLHRGFAAGLGHFGLLVLFQALLFTGLLRLILRLMCAGFCAALKVFVGNLKIVFSSHGLGVPHPGADHVYGESFRQPRLPSAPQVLKQFGPGRKASPADDLFESGPQVRLCVPPHRNDEFFALRGRIVGSIEVGTQFGEEGNNPGVFPVVISRFGRMNGDSLALPINVTPPQCQGFARAPQPAVPTQSEQQLPLIVWARIQHLIGFVASHEIETARIRLHACLQFRERIARAIKRVLASELLTLDDRSVLLMSHLHADLLLKQATHGTVPAEDVGGDWLDFVSFTGTGSELQSVLDPKWSPLRKEVA